MKKTIVGSVIMLSGILATMGVIMFSSCTNTANQKIERAESNVDAQKVAKKFVMEFYTVDSDEIKNYNAFLDLKTTNIQELIDAIESNDEVIKSLMTEKAYNIFVENRENLMLAMFCALNECTIEVLELNLIENAVKENECDYNFQVKINFIQNKEKSLEKTDIGKGYLRLIEENGEWKVSDFREIEFPKSIE